jgi:hypothetical protein
VIGHCQAQLGANFLPAIKPVKKCIEDHEIHEGNFQFEMGLLKNWENRYSGWQCRLTIIYCAARGGDSGNVFVTALR